jgi:hypothetical protein
MMARLPDQGGDVGNWGILLNDFLSVSHLADGSLRGVINVVNVKDFGAVGDGTTDDTAAIQQALDSVAHRGTVFIPQPTVSYKTTESLRIEKSLQLLGGGILPTINLVGNDAPVISVHASEISVVIIDNFHLVGGSMGIDLSGENLTRHSRFRNLDIHGCTEAGINIRTGLIGAEFENVQIRSSPDYGIRCLNTTYINAVRFVTCRIAGTDVAAVQFQHDYTSSVHIVTFINPIIEGNRSTGLVFRGGYIIRIYDPHFEKNGTRDGKPDIDLGSNAHLRAICEVHLLGGSFSAPSQAQIDIGMERVRFDTHHAALVLNGTRINASHVINANNNTAGVRIAFVNVQNVPTVVKYPSSAYTSLRGGHLRLGRGVETAGVSHFDEVANGSIRRNLRGEITISDSHSSGDVNFTFPEPDELYFLNVTPVGQTGEPAEGSNRVKWIEKSKKRFTVHLEVAPGKGSSVSFDWQLIG